MFGVIDCGTTNTRVYIINDKLEVISKEYKKVGVRDTSISGSRNLLKDGIKEAFLKALDNAGLKLKDIDFAVASGMITSEIGLIDIPHLIAPVGIKELSENIKIVEDKNIFPLEIPVIFIRGIKNDYEGIGVNEIRNIDFMRGEETQIIGLLETYKPKLPLNVIILSSHTKLIHINEIGQVQGSITTISGQIYEAISKETFIGGCIKKLNNFEEENNYFSTELLRTANESVQSAGFLRTLLMPRFMEVLLDTKWYERKFFVDSAIASEDIRILNEAEKLLGYNLDTNYFLIGHEGRCKIYEELIKNRIKLERKIKSIFKKEEIDMLTINGVLAILKLLQHIEK